MSINSKRCNKCGMRYEEHLTACPNCGCTKLWGYQAIKNKKVRNAMENIKVFLGGGIFILSIITIIILGIQSCSMDDKPTAEEQANQQKWADCRSRSDTYHTCSWSHWENRCVCKQR